MEAGGAAYRAVDVRLIRALTIIGPWPQVDPWAPRKIALDADRVRLWRERP
jgi:hypothetical protein